VANENLSLDSDFTDEQYRGAGASTFSPQAPTVTTTFGNALFTAADAAAARGVLSLGTIATQSASGVVITGGSINGTTVGASTRSSGRFTTLDASVSLQLPNLKWLGYTTTAADPTIAELPADRDVAIHKNSGSGNVFLAFNNGGSILKVQLT
jgi:hypothetical protein